LGVSTLLEWDAHIPPFERLQQELDRARRWLEQDAGDREAGPSGSPGFEVSRAIPQPAVFVGADVE
jgi:hypothetical protein